MGYIDTSGITDSYGMGLSDSMTSSGVVDVAPTPDLDVLKDMFQGDATDGESLDNMLAKMVGEAFKELDAHSEKEKNLRGGIHVFGQFKQAMKAAFPGWPHDTDSADKFSEDIASVAHGKSAEPVFRTKPEVKAAYDRFVKTAFPKRTSAFTPEKAFGILKILSKGVKYCEASVAEQKYKVELGAKLTRRGEVFDSKDLFDQKTVRYNQGSIAGGGDWTKFRSIWVMSWDQSGEPEFFTHLGKIGRFHHSSFRAGEAIMAAGEWLIERGDCKMINSCSGHYRPESWRFLAACIQLKNRGVITPQTVVEVWKTSDKSRELVPCLGFIANFERSLGTYSLYP